MLNELIRRVRMRREGLRLMAEAQRFMATTRLEQCFAGPGEETVADVAARDGLERVIILPPASLLLPPDGPGRTEAALRLRSEYLRAQE